MARTRVLTGVLEDGLPATPGVAAARLDDATLLRHLRTLHRTRLDALRHASHQALVTHIARTGELEVEYLRRNPSREVSRCAGPS